jgi:glycerol uptake facilitator-like aquaporin
MNPALTTAVFIANKDMRKWKYAMMTMLSQIVGGLLGM